MISEFSTVPCTFVLVGNGLKQFESMHSPEITCTGETCDALNGTKSGTFPSNYTAHYQTQGLCSSSNPTLQQSSSSFGGPRYYASRVQDGLLPEKERMASHSKEMSCHMITVNEKVTNNEEEFVKSTVLSKCVKGEKKGIVLENLKKKTTQFEALALYLQRGSLEFYKDGLLTSCFIIFFDFWCELLKHEDALAHTFFNEYYRLFLPEHVMDIDEMKQITHFHQIKSSEHLQKWIGKNIQVSISPLSYRLLLIFLSEPDYASMLHCVITRIQFLMSNDDQINFTKEDVYSVKTYLNKKSFHNDSCSKPTKSPFYDVESSYEEKAPFVLNWGLLSGAFNKFERLDSTEKLPDYLEGDRPFLALINGEVTQPVDPNLALPFTNESKWALDAWYQYHLHQTSRTMHRGSIENFPSILSFNLDCVTDELTVVKLSHWSSSPWLLAARQSGAIGLWDLPTLLKASQNNTKEENNEAGTTLNSNVDEEKNNQVNTSIPQILISHTCSVTALTFVPPATPSSAILGPTLREQNCLSASADGTIRLWSLSNASALASYPPYQIPIYSLDVSPFGNFFLSGGGQGLSCMYSFSREYPLRVFTSHQNDVLVTKCSPNSLLMATGSMDALVKLWDIRTAKPLVSLKYKTSPIRNVAFSPNGRLLASYFHSTHSSTIVVWDIGTQKMLGSVLLPAQMGHATSMAFSYGSHTLLIACSYGALVHILVDDLLHHSSTSTCVENFYNGQSQSFSTSPSSCQMSIIPLGKRLAADIVFTPENVAAICSIPMTNNSFIPSF